MKKIRLINIFVTAILVCGFLHACKWGWDVKIDQESKDYCLFGQGSYWIYRDSATLTIDSIVINRSVDYVHCSAGGGDNNMHCETYETVISLYSQDSIYDFPIELTTRYADPELLKPCLLEKGRRGDIFYQNGEIGEVLYGSLSYAKNMILLEKKNNYSINGVTYSNVKIFEWNYFEERKVYYWAKHVGLIRMEIYEKDNVIVKNLVKYNVKPYKH